MSYRNSLAWRRDCLVVALFVALLAFRCRRRSPAQLVVRPGLHVSGHPRRECHREDGRTADGSDDPDKCRRVLQLRGAPPGHYEITFEAAGFQRQARTGINLTVNQNVRVDATLAVGSIETEITVTGSAPLVDTVSPTLSALVDDRRVVDLPLNGRNIMALASILPGVLAVSASQQMNDARSGPRMNVNGDGPT